MVPPTEKNRNQSLKNCKFFCHTRTDVAMCSASSCRKTNPTFTCIRSVYARQTLGGVFYLSIYLMRQARAAFPRAPRDAPNGSFPLMQPQCSAFDGMQVRTNRYLAQNRDRISKSPATFYENIRIRSRLFAYGPFRRRSDYLVESFRAFSIDLATCVAKN